MHSVKYDFRLDSKIKMLMHRKFRYPLILIDILSEKQFKMNFYKRLLVITFHNSCCLHTIVQGEYNSDALF